MPIILMMDGTKTPIEQEKSDILIDSLKTGSVKWVEVNGALINTSCISGIYPDKAVKKKLFSGRLHDGTRVMLHYGNWASAEDPTGVRLDPKYYPELTKDLIMDDATWEKFIMPLKTSQQRKDEYFAIMQAGKEQPPKKLIDYTKLMKIGD